MTQLLFFVETKIFLCIYRFFQLLGASFIATFLLLGLFLIGEIRLLFPPNIESIFESLYATTKMLLIFDIIGHVMAAPSLFLFFFPWSLWIWQKKVPNVWIYAFVGCLAATINGLLFFIPPWTCHGDCDGFDIGYGGLALFAGSGLATALLHWLWRRREYMQHHQNSGGVN